MSLSRIYPTLSLTESANLSYVVALPNRLEVQSLSAAQFFEVRMIEIRQAMVDAVPHTGKVEHTLHKRLAGSMC